MQAFQQCSCLDHHYTSLLSRANILQALYSPIVCMLWRGRPCIVLVHYFYTSKICLTRVCTSQPCCVTGSRSKVYSFMYSAGLAGMSIGPCAAAATFAVTGNAWHIQTLQHVILVGMVLAVLPILTLLCFDDDHSLGEESDAVRHHQTALQSQTAGLSQCLLAQLSSCSCVLQC